MHLEEDELGIDLLGSSFEENDPGFSGSNDPELFQMSILGLSGQEQDFHRRGYLQSSGVRMYFLTI